MSKKIRYSLIAAGFIIFIILAPLIVMYVRGLTFDFEQKKFVQTGILAIRSDPKDAQVYLNGNLVRQTAGDLKFLPPKEYSITLGKRGYFNWSKRLQVNENLVTWANPYTGKIILFLNPPINSTLTEAAADFSQPVKSASLFYLSNNNLIISHPDKPDLSEIISLPKAVNSIISSDDGKQLLLTDTNTLSSLLVNTQTGQVTDLSGQFSEPVRWLFSGSGNLFAQDKDRLYRMDLQARQKFLVQSGVKTLTFLNNDAYILKAKNNALSLSVLTDFTGDGQEILGHIPLFNEAQILVSYEKQILMLGDGTLYKVGSALTVLGANIQSWEFNDQQSSIIFFHNGELDYLNSSGNDVNFITRRGFDLSSPLIRLDLNYALFVENNKIKALELDARDHQNEYDLYDGVDIKKFTLEADGKVLTVLDGETLKTVAIR